MWCSTKYLITLYDIIHKKKVTMNKVEVQGTSQSYKQRNLIPHKINESKYYVTCPSARVSFIWSVVICYLLHCWLWVAMLDKNWPINLHDHKVVLYSIRKYVMRSETLSHRVTNEKIYNWILSTVETQCHDTICSVC